MPNRHFDYRWIILLLAVTGLILFGCSGSEQETAAAEVKAKVVYYSMPG